MNSTVKHQKERMWISFIKCYLISLAAAAALMCLLTAAVLSLPDPEPFCPAVSLAIMAALCFFGARVCTGRTNGKGSVTGLLFGVLTAGLCVLSATALSLPLSPMIFSGMALGMIFLSFIGGRSGEKKKASGKKRRRRRPV